MDDYVPLRESRTVLYGNYSPNIGIILTIYLNEISANVKIKGNNGIPMSLEKFDKIDSSIVVESEKK